MNHYGYCWSNPVGLVDNDGNWPTVIIGAAIGGAVTGAVIGTGVGAVALATGCSTAAAVGTVSIAAVNKFFPEDNIYAEENCGEH